MGHTHTHTHTRTYTHANNEPEKKIRTASVEPEKLNLTPRTTGPICEREKMSDKRRVPGLQPICLGQQLKNGQRKKTIPALKVRPIFPRFLVDSKCSHCREL